eukprot:g3806.t1
MGLVTPLGKLLDPLADKILVSAAFVVLTERGLCPVWITALIIGREFLVTGLRQIAIEAGEVLAADRLGKWKTTFQLTYIISALIWLTLETIPTLQQPLIFLHTLTRPMSEGGVLLPVSLTLALALTVISGFETAPAKLRSHILIEKSGQNREAPLPDAIENLLKADLKTFQHFGLHGLTAVTCIVSETANIVRRVDFVSPGMVEDQVRLMLESFPLTVVKTGMLGSAGLVSTVARVFADHPDIKLVVDPVMIASTGASLLEDDAIRTYKEELLPKAYLITPNLPEAEVLLGRKITSEAGMHEAAAELSSTYRCATLLKGGHLGQAVCTDILFAGGTPETFSSPRLDVAASHGTGCTFAAAIAANLALGQNLPSAVSTAKTYLNRTLSESYTFHNGTVTPIHALNQGTNFPSYSYTVGERLEMLRASVPESDRLEIAHFDNSYLVEYAKIHDAAYVLRGIRSPSDYEYERVMRHINSDMAPEITTVFLMPPRDIAELSSSMIKSLTGPEGWEETVKRYVPPEVFKVLKQGPDV